MDEVMRYLQGSIEETEIERFRTLSVWVGVAWPYRSKACTRSGLSGANRAMGLYVQVNLLKNEIGSICWFRLEEF